MRISLDCVQIILFYSMKIVEARLRKRANAHNFFLRDLFHADFFLVCAHDCALREHDCLRVYN